MRLHTSYHTPSHFYLLACAFQYRCKHFRLIQLSREHIVISLVGLLLISLVTCSALATIWMVTVFECRGCSRGTGLPALAAVGSAARGRVGGWMHA
jgi:hypothetical protein